MTARHEQARQKTGQFAIRQCPLTPWQARLHLSPDPPIGAQGDGQSAVRESARLPAGLHSYPLYEGRPRVRGTPATTTGSPELRPGTGARTRAAGLVAGARWSLASDVNFSHASRARWNEQVNTAPRAVAKPMEHIHSRCAPNISMMSESKDSGNYRPSIGRDHPCIA